MSKECDGYGYSSGRRKLVRRKYVAKILDVTDRTVDRLVDSGRLRAVYVGGLKMITADSLDALIDGKA
jgi:excisionase family DNA binding protein